MEYKLQMFGGRGALSNKQSTSTNSEGEPIAPKKVWDTFERRINNELDYDYSDAIEMLDEYAKQAREDWGDPNMANMLTGIADRIQNGTASTKDLQEAWDQLNPY